MCSHNLLLRVYIQPNNVDGTMWTDPIRIELGWVDFFEFELIWFGFRFIGQNFGLTKIYKLY